MLTEEAGFMKLFSCLNPVCFLSVLLLELCKIDLFTLFLFPLCRQIGFIDNGNTEEYEALKFAVAHSNTKSNISIILKVFNTSTSVGLFDRGKKS